MGWHLEIDVNYLLQNKLHFEVGQRQRKQVDPDLKDLKQSSELGLIVVTMGKNYLVYNSLL